jgi:bifunctional enzyme CysN/CysC
MRPDKFDDKTQLRFLTCGSVDDGKSTLIGRLLYDSGCLFEDQLSALRKESLKKNADGELDFSLLMDGLLAEREQGITIDVAYRYFETKRRKFIVADAPGHEQYTGNMATGASNSEAAVVLADARNGILPQTARHTYIAALLGIRDIVLAVNKMDLTGWSQDVFDGIARGYGELVKKIEKSENGVSENNVSQNNVPELSVVCIPLSASKGDNVFVRSGNMPWYRGPTLMEYLENAEPRRKQAQPSPFRMPVQRAVRPGSGFRGYSGTISGGAVRVGDEIAVLPSGLCAAVESILSGGEKRTEAEKGEAVTLTLSREIDVSRGDVLSGANERPTAANHFRAAVIWMNEAKLLPEREYLLKIASRTVPAAVTNIRGKVNVETLAMEPASALSINEIGVCNVRTASPVVCEPYSASRELGGFILIDRVTGDTVAAGMIRYPLRRSANVSPQAFEVTQEARGALMGQKPRVLWFTGLSGSGKSTLANLAEKKLFAARKHSYILDGDNVRLGLNKDLGFTEADRVENIRRVAEVAKLMADAGLIVLATFISPFRRDREYARSLFKPGEFIEVFVDTPLEICEKRDPKGLYKKARSGRIPNFTGLDSPYEKPENPEITVRGGAPEDLEPEAEKIVKACMEA